MLSKSQLWICFIGGCAIIVGLIVMWLLRPGAQIIPPPDMLWRWLGVVLLPVGAILILFGVQRTPRRLIRLARAVGAYLFLGVIFWAGLLGVWTVRAGSFSMFLDLVREFGQSPWVGYLILFWPQVFIGVFGIFGYRFLD